MYSTNVEMSDCSHTANYQQRPEPSYMGDDDDAYLESHKSVTSVRRRDVTNELRGKIFQRISERRS